MKMAIPTISGAATSETSTKPEDQEMEDAVTSNPAPPSIVIDLPDDDDEEPLRQRRNRRASADKIAQVVSAPETLIAEGDNATRPTVSFAVPLTSARPSSSSADQPSLFSTHHVPEDQASAAREAIRQAGVMMEQVKAIRDASQVAYDASSTLQSNVQKSCELATRYTELENKHIQLELDLKLVQENFTKAKEEAKDKLRDSLKKKNLELAEAQKAASEKTKLTEEKLASVSKLEEQNTNLKAALDTANKYASRLKSDKLALSDKASELAGKKNDLEIYLGGLAKKLFLMLEGFVGK